jgi:hypothetical protein
LGKRKDGDINKTRLFWEVNEFICINYDLICLFACIDIHFCRKDSHTKNDLLWAWDNNELSS